MSEIVLVVLFFTVLSISLNIRNRQGLNVQSLTSHRVMFCVVAAVSWGLLSALRHVSIGADTVAYGQHFDQVKSISFGELWGRVITTYVTKTAVYKDPGYNLLVKALQLISGEYRFLLIFIAALFFGSMGVWIYRHSQMPYVSFLLFSTLFYGFFAFTGHRQTIATAMVVFLGDGLIRKRKLIPFVLLTAAAALIHKSCICYLLAYFVYPFKDYSRGRYIAVLGLLMAIAMLSESFLRVIAQWLNYESYLHNEIGGTGTFVLLYFIVILIMIWKFPSIVKENPEAYHTMNILMVASIAVAAAAINQSFMRVQQYFTLHLMLLLPDVIVSFRGRNRFIVGVSGCCLLLALMIKNNPAYLFYWQ